MIPVSMRRAIRNDLDRTLARVVLGAIDEFTDVVGETPTATDVARLLVGGAGRARDPWAQQLPGGIPVRDLLFGGLLARLTPADIRDAIAILESLGLIERAEDRPTRLALTPQGEQYLLGRTERATGLLEHLFVRPDREGATYQALRELRRKLAQENDLSPGYVFSERTLRALAAKRPKTLDELHAIPGLGPAKIARYGRAILDVLERLPPRDDLDEYLATSVFDPTFDLPLAAPSFGPGANDPPGRHAHRSTLAT